MISDDSTGKANDKKQIGVYMKHFPCGTSLKCLNHCVQIYQSKIFTMYDYRDEANVFLYKSLKPPEYPVHNIKDIPIMLVGGQEDKLAAPGDVNWLYSQISSTVVYFKLEPEMGHISFLCGNSIEWFKGILDLIKQRYSNIQ